jgi:hypothetical protein
MQHGIVEKLAALYPKRFTIHHPWWGPRPYLKLDGKIEVSVYVCPYVETRNRMYWRFVPRPAERRNVTLCCLASPTNDSIASMYLRRSGEIRKVRLNIRPGDRWFSVDRTDS